MQAFETKVIQKIETNDGTITQHKKGCHCKKSNCKKKYCECFQVQSDCNNKDGSVTKAQFCSPYEVDVTRLDISLE